MLFTLSYLNSTSPFCWPLASGPLRFHANIMKKRLLRLRNRSPSAEPHRIIMPDSFSVSSFTVLKTKNARRRRSEILRLKYTCKTMMNITITEQETDVKEDNLQNGVVLASIEKEKNQETENVTYVSHGSVSVMGRRREMEDAVRAEIGFMVREGERYDFYGVYDGHGGARVAEACKERMHRVLAEEICREEGKGVDWERAMEVCFEKMDEEVNRGRMDEEMVGSTAVVAVVGRETVVVANCGDSRAVLSRSGTAISLSSDHKPDRPDELERVEAAGGRVINWNGHRILGVLATSRSIGDQCLKPYVISKPEVTVSKLTDGDEFLILASDGLWDVFSNEVACRVVRRCLSRHTQRKSQSAGVPMQGRATEAAALLAELAMARGSRDNISVTVVELGKF